jgi:hypothetical protein
MNGTKHPADDNFWMGDSRGHWDGDTLVVDASNFNDKTWFDMAGDFHSDALHVVERYRMTDRDTIQYQATIEDSKVFTKPWTINIALHRRTDRTRLYEYVCQAEAEETSGLFTREDKTWYPGNATAPPANLDASTYVSPAVPPVANLRRTPDGKPDMQGFYESKAGGTSRNLTERGYDDPTAHCFPPGVPRAMWVPEGYQIIQTPDHIVFLHERVAWRIVPIMDREKAAHAHLPDNMRLWQGDSIGHWEGDTLVIDTTNLNGKEWLGEGGEVMSYAEHVVERFTPTSQDSFRYEATVTDPISYTRPWTISFPIQREKFELREAACHEEDHDLPHLKALKDAAAKKK